MFALSPKLVAASLLVALFALIAPSPALAHERRKIGDYEVVVGWINEPAIQGDFAIVKAWKGDRYGNLVYRKTAMNFNPMMATAAKVTIAEVEELVEVGELDPDAVHTPGIFVHRIVEGAKYEKRIERRTVQKPAAGAKE